MKKFFKDNKIYIIIGIVAIALICALGINLNRVRADSGWDTSYDSGGWDIGGGGDYGGGWDSSDSWSSGGSSGGYSSGDPSSFIFVLFLFIIFIVILSMLSEASHKGGSRTKNLVMRADISEDRIKELLPDETLGSLKHMAFEKFIQIQNAWMDFDNDKLRELCTDELYNTYVADLDVLKIKNGKNIMSDFDQEEIKIVDIKNENDIVTVTVYLRVNFYDYVINEKDQTVIRGNKTYKITNNYNMDFVRVKKKPKKEIRCPNCGAEVKAVTSGKCEYCGSTIVVNANEFVLSKKTNINSKM